MSNRFVRLQLIKEYGPICMLGGIPDHKHILTLHHIDPVRDGGLTTIQNGALFVDYMHEAYNLMESYYPRDAKYITEGVIYFKETRENIVRRQLNELIQLKLLLLDIPVSNDIIKVLRKNKEAS